MKSKRLGLARRLRAFTTIEVMISSVIVMMIGTSLTSITYIAARQTQSSLKQVIIERDCRTFINQARDSIQSSALVTLSANSSEITITDGDGNSEQYSFTGGELRHYPTAGTANFDVLIEDVAPDSTFEVTTIPGRPQRLRLFFGTRDPQDRDGMNYFYFDSTITSRIPIPV